MTSNLSCHFVFFLWILGIWMAGCEQRPLTPEKRARVLQDHIRPNLNTIAPELALFDANNRFARMIHCAVNRSVNWSTALCPVFQEAERFTSLLVQSTLLKNKNFQKGYLFFLKPHLKGGRPDLLGLVITENGEEPIGLFETLSDCRRSEETFSKNGWQVTVCRLWVKEDIRYQMFDLQTQKETIRNFNSSNLR